MSDIVSGRGRGKRGRIQPYAWLGAGAVTIGLGAGMIGGAGLALADTDSGAGATSSASDSAGAAAKSDAKASSARGHSARKSAGAGDVSRRLAGVQKPDTASSDAISSDDIAKPDADVTADLPTAAAGDSEESSSAVEAAAETKASAGRSRAVAEVETPAPAAATPSPAADISFSTTSWIDTPTPGASVELALQQIADAQALLNEQTWGSGNVLAGLASIAPQLFLFQASSSLNNWSNGLPGTQQFVADTMNVPFLHQVAQASLLSTLALPSIAVAQMNIAALFIPLVSLFGASQAATGATTLINSAKVNGQVYGVVPLTMKANTEPVVYITLNDGSRVPVLVDTGASGLIISSNAVGTNFGTPIGSGSSGFSGGLQYDYTTYNAVVDFGNGIVTTPTAINVVDPDDAQEFDDYFYPAGVVGVLGIGANSAGPGPSLPNAALPGELGNGVLVYEDLGVMVFGPNPFPAWATIPGAPNANLVVKVGNNDAYPAYAIIDSGGVYGTMPKYINGGSSNIPAGTRISVYTNDGQTLLYTYTTQGVNSPTVVPDNSLLNTGNEPFAQYPIYIDYSPSHGLGETVFTYF